MTRAMAKRIKAPASKHAQATRVKPAVILDDTFFHMSQLKVGDTLICYGRWQPLSRWVIVNFDSHYLGKTVGVIKVKKVNELRRLGDIVTVRNIDTQEIKKLSFSYMSYSAIWRLAPDAKAEAADEG